MLVAVCQDEKGVFFTRAMRVDRPTLRFEIVTTYEEAHTYLASGAYPVHADMYQDRYDFDSLVAFLKTDIAGLPALKVHMMAFARNYLTPCTGAKITSKCLFNQYAAATGNPMNLTQRGFSRAFNDLELYRMHRTTVDGKCVNVYLDVIMQEK